MAHFFKKNNSCLKKFSLIILNTFVLELCLKAHEVGSLLQRAIRLQKICKGFFICANHKRQRTNSRLLIDQARLPLFTVIVVLQLPTHCKQANTIIPK